MSAIKLMALPLVGDGVPVAAHALVITAAAAAAAAVPDAAESSDGCNTKNSVTARRRQHELLRPPLAQQR